MKTLTVIVPNYNHARYLKGCLHSIFASTFMPMEVLVIDDASTDNSVGVIERISRGAPGIIMTRNPENIGAVANCNKGLAMARGEYVCYVAADDLVDTTWFERGLKCMEHMEDVNPAICFCDPASFDGETGKISPNPLWLWPQPRYMSSRLLASIARDRRTLIGGSVIYRTSALRAIGGFNPAFEWHADFHANVVIALHNGACYVPGPWALWRSTPGSYMAAGIKSAKQAVIARSMINAMAVSREWDLISQSRMLHVIPGALSALIRKGELGKAVDWQFLRRAICTEIFHRLPRLLRGFAKRLTGFLTRGFTPMGFLGEKSLN